MTITEPGTPRRGNPVGIASLALGILLLLAGLGAQTLSPALPFLLERTGMSYQAIPYLFGIPQAVIATIATALGVVALAQQQSVRASGQVRGCSRRGRRRHGTPGGRERA